MPWLEPYPDLLLDQLTSTEPGPEARYEATEAISLAFSPGEGWARLVTRMLDM